MTTKSRVRRAVVVADAVTVACPHCEELFCTKDGSQMWAVEDFDGDFVAPKTCSNCGHSVLISRPFRVRF